MPASAWENTPRVCLRAGKRGLARSDFRLLIGPMHGRSPVLESYAGRFSASFSGLSPPGAASEFPQIDPFSDRFRRALGYTLGYKQTALNTIALRRGSAAVLSCRIGCVTICVCVLARAAREHRFRSSTGLASKCPATHISSLERTCNSHLVRRVPPLAAEATEHLPEFHGNVAADNDEGRR